MLFVTQRSLIYHPIQNIGPLSAYGIEDIVEEVTVTTYDKLELHGWYFPPSQKDYPSILFFHGNAGNISHRLHKITPIVKEGYGVLLAEYRGYGGNPGKPTEQGLYNDAFAWLQALQEYTEPENIVLYGESLGSGVAIELASKSSFKAVILETPFTRLSDPARHFYFFIPFLDYVIRDKFASIDKIDSINAPLLFLLAHNDEVIGFETGKALYEAASAPKILKIYETGQHNNLTDHGSTQDVLDFLYGL